MAPASAFVAVSQNSNIGANAQGDHVALTAAAGSSYAAITIGFRSYDPFNLTADADNYPTGIAERAGTVTVTSTGAHSWTASTVRTDRDDKSDYTIVPGDFDANEAKWNLDGYFPSIQINSLLNVADVTDVALNTMFSTSDWFEGERIFDGGVDFIVAQLDLISSLQERFGFRTSAANPALNALSGSMTLGGLVVAVAIMKSGNALGDAILTNAGGTHNVTLTRIAAGKCVGCEAHYVVAVGNADDSDQDRVTWANPLGYEIMMGAVSYV